MSRRSLLLSLIAVSAAAAVLVAAGGATAPPVGQLPAGPTVRIGTVKGELVAVALPHRAGGRAWRIARPFDSQVLQQVSEADVGKQVVLVFNARDVGGTTLTFALTRGERTKAYESRRYVIAVKAS